MPLSTVSHGQAATSATPSGPARTRRLAPCAAQRLPQRGYGVGVGDGDRVGPELGRLLGQQVDPAASGGERRHPETAGVTGDDIEGLGADGAGGAQQDDGTNGVWLHRTILSADVQLSNRTEICKAWNAR